MTSEQQCASAVLVIRPAGFLSNPQTAESNKFQRAASLDQQSEEQPRALAEFEALIKVIEQAGVRVHVYDDTPEPHTPDAVFPNNWVSFHADGTVVLYPMLAENRRTERRLDIIEDLAMNEGYRVLDTVDLSHHETNGVFLEGTGSMVLDRVNRIAYACVSPRTDLDPLGEFGQRLDFEIVAFHSFDAAGQPIYHTNVMMCIGADFAVICAESITDDNQRFAVLDSLRNTGHTIVEIDFLQVEQFAGNMLALENANGEAILAMSRRAEESLTTEQRKILSRFARIVSAPINTIEDSAGGSVRCMLAEVHLPRV